MPRRRSSDRGSLRGTLKLLCVAIVVMLGGFLLSQKVTAQAQTPAASAKPALRVRVAASASAAPVAAEPGPAPSASSPAPAPSASAISPIDYAVEGPEGVPIHTEGPFRSPLAHPRFGGPVVAKVGFLLNHVRNYDIKEGTFTAEFYLSLTSKKPMPSVDLDTTNGKLEERELVADSPTFKLYHMRGTFSTEPDLRAYPFDKQHIEIEIEDNKLGSDQIRLVAEEEHTNLGQEFAMAGWRVEDFEARILEHHYPLRFAHDDLYQGRYHFIVGIRRFANSAVFSVFVPAFVIVFISLLGLWLPRDELEVRSNAAAPMLAAAVIFHFTLNQALPATPYLTRADKLMVGVYLSLVLNMVATWLWFLFDKKHEELIFKLGKWVVPPATIVVMALACTL